MLCTSCTTQHATMVCATPKISNIELTPHPTPGIKLVPFGKARKTPASKQRDFESPFASPAPTYHQNVCQAAQPAGAGAQQHNWLKVTAITNPSVTNLGLVAENR